MNHKTVYGIDLGTTNCCISRAYHKKFEVIEIDNSKVVPSVIAHDGEKWIVGNSALNYSKIDPERSLASIKRHIGDSQYRKKIGDTCLTPVEVSAKILEYIKQKAQEKVGEKIEDVVITVPAYFNNVQRHATVTAGKMAGLNVLRIINEPTAASLVFDLGTTSSDSDLTSTDPVEEKWLVYDLGGGTFDVTILSAKEGIKEVLASTGNNFLGGDDFDQKIVSWLIDKIRDSHGVDVSHDQVSCAKLKHLAEEAKVELSIETKKDIVEVLEIEGKKINLKFTLTREQFEFMIQDYIDSTIEKTKQALQDANCTPEEISKLLLVGGSTRIPLVSRQLDQKLGLKGQSYIDPDLAVSLGASVQAAICSGLSFENIVIDVAPHTLGIAAMGYLDFEHEGNDIFPPVPKAIGNSKETAPIDPLELAKNRHPRTFAPVISRNSRLPSKFVEKFRTGYENQSTIEVAVYQGESPNTKDNLFVGSFRAQIAPAPIGSEVHIGMEYDLNGVVKINVAQGEGGVHAHSHKMDLYQSALLNTDTKGLKSNFLDYDYAHEDEDSDDHVCPEETKQLDSKIMNLLVQKVEESLADRTGQEEARQLLKQYMVSLNNNDDDEMDTLEDKLHDWLDSQTTELSE